MSREQLNCNNQDVFGASEAEIWDVWTDIHCNDGLLLMDGFPRAETSAGYSLRGKDETRPTTRSWTHPPSASSIITSKITEHESVTSASQLLQRRCSLELPQNPSVKHGPPIHAKPTRLPDGISMLLGSREHVPHSIATEAVSMQEDALKLLRFSAPSFRDPTPNKSRMEALSKLGLAQRRSQSNMHTSPKETKGIKTTTTFKTSISANASADVRATDTTDHCKTRQSQSIMHASPRETESVKTTTTLKTSIPANTRQTENAKTITTFKTSLPANASPDARAMDTTDHC